MKTVLVLTVLAGVVLPAQADGFNMLETDERPSLEDFAEDPDTVLLVPTDKGFRQVQPEELGNLPEGAWAVPMTNPVMRVPALPETVPVEERHIYPDRAPEKQ